MDSMPLLEWFANHYKDFGATLEIITDRSQEGAQFVRGFGGIGGELWAIYQFPKWIEVTLNLFVDEPCRGQVIEYTVFSII